MGKKIDVSIIAGSFSNLEVVSEAVGLLNFFGLSYSINIASAHRTPEYLKKCIKTAEGEGAKIFITFAGMAAALSGVVAAETLLPVIGVPMEGENLSSMDSLFATVQMPKGVPVATVAIGKAGAVNAVILAVQIMALSDKKLKEKLLSYRKEQERKIIGENEKLNNFGIEKYLEERKS
jgi:5-(carboxyamino)imidazole ribonucleotide mutase